jgi:flagellar hook protein FlgE
LVGVNALGEMPGCDDIESASSRSRFFPKENHVPSIVNGLFAGRSGIASHGLAIAVVGDNISNASTIGYKSARAEFEDLIAGGGTSGKTVGSGSSIGAISTTFEQGTLESTGRPLDLAVDGNGFFVVAKDEQRFYTRAGNFKVDSAGFIINQSNLAVLGFPATGSGRLEPLNINSIEQSSVATTDVAIAGNINSSAPLVAAATIPDPGLAVPATVTYSNLRDSAAYSTVVDVFDTLGKSHTLTMYFYHTSATAPQYTVRAYANNEDIDTTGTQTGFPRQVGTDISMSFGGDGQRTNNPATGAVDITAAIAWNNGSLASGIGISLVPFTSYSSANNILSITQDGKGVGAVTSISIQPNGGISALLSNGQSATIGTVGLVNFANPEGLVRVGKNLLTQSPSSGEPIVGQPTTGTFGAIRSGSQELSTVDIASEFVKLITLQRGFQASSRIITTINQLLNEIIQLA